MHGIDPAGFDGLDLCRPFHELGFDREAELLGHPRHDLPVDADELAILGSGARHVAVVGDGQLAGSDQVRVLADRLGETRRGARENRPETCDADQLIPEVTSNHNKLSRFHSAYRIWRRHGACRPMPIQASNLNFPERPTYTSVSSAKLAQFDARLSRATAIMIRRHRS